MPPKPAQSKANYDDLLADDMGRFFDDPLGFVMYAFEWDADPSIQGIPLQEPWRSRYGVDFGPEKWACEFFDSLGEQIRKHGFDGKTSVDPIQEATASGHGITKSATVAQLILFIMSTRPFTKGTVTAGSYKQLQTKTWSEVVKWTNHCITGHWFETSSAALWMRHKDHPDTWRCDAISCAKENADSFQGQHNSTSTSLYIFDEGSAVPRPIWEAASGGLTDGEPMWFVFGNPTENSGPFKDCFGKYRNLWNTRQIDSRDCHLPNKALLQRWIDTYGIDSDYVKVRIRGMFPAMSVKQFISVADVDAAFGKVLTPDQYRFAPKILTCDPAWEGDDELVIGLRQGLYFQILRTIPKNDNDMYIANLLANHEDQEKADAVFIDAGYGTGIVSAGKTMGRNWQLIWFSEESSDPGCLNKRAEMWKLMRDWLKAGGVIPKDQRLYDDIIGPQTVPRPDGKIQLESKKDMKSRGEPSPGRGDALALSFARPVVSKKQKELQGIKGFNQTQTDNTGKGLFWG